MSDLQNKYEKHLEFLDAKIGLLEDMMKSNRKDGIFTIILGLAFLTVLTVLPLVSDKQINSLDVLSISVMVVSTHDFLTTHLKHQRDIKCDLSKAKFQRDNITDMLVKLNNSESKVED